MDGGGVLSQQSLCDPSLRPQWSLDTVSLECTMDTTQGPLHDENHLNSRDRLLDKNKTGRAVQGKYFIEARR